MKRSVTVIMVAVLALVLSVALIGCGPTPSGSSDQQQTGQQETLLSEATKQTGMPNIKNFRERKLLKTILEMRDQEGLVTYTYVENMIPTVVPGHTAMGGKFTYVGESVGYGLPYATQYTNPQKIEESHYDMGYAILPQADPNALYSPESAEGTWVLLRDPNGKKGTQVSYMESRIEVFAFKLPFDK